MASITPVRDRIVVKRICPSDVRPGGIILAGKLRDDLAEGIVLKVGPGKITKRGFLPVSVPVGAKILFGAEAGVDIELDDERFLILREEEVEGITQ